MENSMSLQTVSSSRAVRVKAYTAAGTLLVCLALLSAYGFYRERRQAEAHQAFVQTIRTLMDVPQTASEQRLFAALSHYAAEHEEGRRARLARMAGVEPDWTRILQRINRAGMARRAEFYQAAAKEYGLANTVSPADIERYVLQREHPSHMSPAPQMVEPTAVN